MVKDYNGSSYVSHSKFLIFAQGNGVSIWPIIPQNIHDIACHMKMANDGNVHQSERPLKLHFYISEFLKYKGDHLCRQLWHSTLRMQHVTGDGILKLYQPETLSTNVRFFCTLSVLSQPRVLFLSRLSYLKLCKRDAPPYARDDCAARGKPGIRWSR